MIFLCGEGLPVPFIPVSCPLCGMLPLVYESSDRSCFCVECIGKDPVPHTFRVTAEDEQRAIDRWIKAFSAPTSASCAPDPRDGRFL